MIVDEFGVLNYTKSQIETALGRALASGLMFLLHADENSTGEFATPDTEEVLISWNLPANNYSKIIIESEVVCKHVNTSGAEIDYVFKIKVGGTEIKSISPIISNKSATGQIGGKFVMPIKGSTNGGQTSMTTIQVTGYYSLSGGMVSALSLRVYGII